MWLNRPCYFITTTPLTGLQIPWHATLNACVAGRLTNSGGHVAYQVEVPVTTAPHHPFITFYSHSSFEGQASSRGLGDPDHHTPGAFKSPQTVLLNVVTNQ